MLPASYPKLLTKIKQCHKQLLLGGNEVEQNIVNMSHTPHIEEFFYANIFMSISRRQQICEKRGQVLTALASKKPESHDKHPRTCQKCSLFVAPSEFII